MLQTAFGEFGGQFSPDGKWVAYQSNESGRPEIYVRPFPGPGGQWQISASGGSQARWGRDGKELFYVAPDRHLMAVPVDIAADGRSMEVRKAVPLFPTRLGILQSGLGLGGAGYAVSPDGQRFLMNAILEDAASAPITIILNWKATP